MDDDVRRTPTRRHLLTVAAAGVAAVALIALGALWHRGERALLEVTAVTGEVTCRGATPRLVESPFDDGFRRPAVPMSKGFVCDIPILVTNRSSHPVRLQRISVPLGGPRAANSFRVRGIGSDNEPWSGDRLDASTSLADRLSQADHTTIWIQIAFRASGCVSEGGTVSVEPDIRLASGVARRRLIVADFPLLLGTRDSACEDGRTSRSTEVRS